MVTTAVPGCRPHEVRPARGNTTCGWLPGGFYAGSPIRCTHWVSPAAGEGIRRDESRKAVDPMTRSLKSVRNPWKATEVRRHPWNAFSRATSHLVIWCTGVRCSPTRRAVQRRCGGGTAWGRIDARHGRISMFFHPLSWALRVLPFRPLTPVSISVATARGSAAREPDSLHRREDVLAGHCETRDSQANPLLAC